MYVFVCVSIRIRLLVATKRSVLKRLFPWQLATHTVFSARSQNHLNLPSDFFSIEDEDEDDFPRDSSESTDYQFEEGPTIPST